MEYVTKCQRKKSHRQCVPIEAQSWAFNILYSEPACPKNVCGMLMKSSKLCALLMMAVYSVVVACFSASSSVRQWSDWRKESFMNEICLCCWRCHQLNKSKYGLLHFSASFLFWFWHDCSPLYADFNAFNTSRMRQSRRPFEGSSCCVYGFFNILLMSTIEIHKFLCWTNCEMVKN